MSEDTPVEETTTVKVATAFSIIKYDDNTYQVSEYDGSKYELERPATRLDVRIGCNEILGAVNRQDMIAELLNVLIPPQPQEEVAPDSQS